jgi:hypothetical protein
MPAVFEKLGIQFMYPDNWTLDESEVLEGNNTVSVYSPGGGFWSIIIHPPELEPAEIVSAAVQAMRQEYDELDAEPRNEKIAGRDVVGMELNFYCLDLTNTAVLRSFSTDDAAYLVICQSDDREYDEIGPVFEAITNSLLSAEPQPPEFENSTKLSPASLFGKQRPLAN